MDKLNNFEDSQFKTANSIVNSPGLIQPKLEEKFSLSKKDDRIPIGQKNKQSLAGSQNKYKQFDHSNQRSDNMTFNQINNNQNPNKLENRQYLNPNRQDSMEKSNGQGPLSLKTSNMSLNVDESYTGSVTLEQMRQEKKKQRILDKQKNKVGGEFGESMMRLQKKIDDLQSHRRLMNEDNEDDAYQDDFIDEKNIDKMIELNNNSNASKKTSKSDNLYNNLMNLNSNDKNDEYNLYDDYNQSKNNDVQQNKDKVVNRIK